MFGRNRAFRDPMVILMEQEARTCKGCKYEQTYWGKVVCDLGKRHGQRCKKYAEKSGPPCSQQSAQP